MAEIAKASKLEARSLPSQAELYHKDVKSQLSEDCGECLSHELTFYFSY